MRADLQNRSDRTGIRLAGCIVVFLLIVSSVFNGCTPASAETVPIETVLAETVPAETVNTVFKEDPVVEEFDPVSTLTAILGCSEKKTAASIYATLDEMIQGEIVSITQIPNNYFTVLEIYDASGNKYTAMIEEPYFLRKILKNGLDGEVIYSAIQ